MLNPESVDKIEDGSNTMIEILFTDDNGHECLKMFLEITDARHLARMILKRTQWEK